MPARIRKMQWKWKKPLRTDVFLHLLLEQSHMTLEGPIRTSQARRPLAAGMQDARCRSLSFPGRYTESRGYWCGRASTLLQRRAQVTALGEVVPEIRFPFRPAPCFCSYQVFSFLPYFDVMSYLLPFQ